jgi:hypothetical protein
MKQIKINKDFLNYKKGQLINVEVDSSGIVLEKYWRSRLKDSHYDNCCELVSESKKKLKEKDNDSNI